MELFTGGRSCYLWTMPGFTAFLVVALYLTHWQRSGIDLLIQILTIKQISAFPQKLNYCFKAKTCFCEGTCFMFWCSNLSRKPHFQILSFTSCLPALLFIKQTQVSSLLTSKIAPRSLFCGSFVSSAYWTLQQMILDCQKSFEHTLGYWSYCSL